MLHKLLELLAIYVESVNVKDHRAHRESLAIRREIESKQTPHSV